MKYIIADPDGQNAIELKKILDGYEILVFQGSYTTIHAAENDCLEHPPDIAFIRLENVELNAFRLAAVIRERNPHSKVIFIGSQIENAVDAYEYGADRFFLIPYNTERIGQWVKQNTGEEKSNHSGYCFLEEFMGGES